MNETQIEEEIEKYRKMGFEDESAKMQEIILGLWAGVDVSTYADPKFNWCQMEQLRLGLTQGLDARVSRLFPTRHLPSELTAERPGPRERKPGWRWTTPEWRKTS